MKSLSVKKVVIVSLLTLFVFASVGVFMLQFLDDDASKKDNKGSSSSSSPSVKVDISKIIADIKKQNPTLEYESTTIPEFTSLVFQENDRYKSIIIDTNTGKEISFNNLIKENQLNEFNNKELELLNLKYPEFIVRGLTNSNGYKIYYVKDTEVIIFYYDYTFDYEYLETISLRIDYNEIKEYLNFTYKLNSSYEVENGYNYVKDKKSVALTLDDGPSITYNAKILEELAKNKAHATFYMVGSMMYSCQICVLNTYKSGNEIGTHTYNHINIKTNTTADVKANLSKTNNLYFKITGENIKTLRPPYGAYDRENLNTLNIPIVLWNIDTEDWRYRDANYIANHIKENVKDGSIILMHELYETSYEALKIVLPWLYANGYQVVSVSELAALKNQSLEAGKAYSHFK